MKLEAGWGSEEAGKALAIRAGCLDGSLLVSRPLSPQVGVPLKNQEVEDIVIYLSSLGKHNTITMDILANTYKQWSMAQQRNSLATARKRAYPSLSCASTSPSWERAWCRKPWPLLQTHFLSVFPSLG